MDETDKLSFHRATTIVSSNFPSTSLSLTCLSHLPVSLPFPFHFRSSFPHFIPLAFGFPSLRLPLCPSLNPTIGVSGPPRGLKVLGTRTRQFLGLLPPSVKNKSHILLYRVQSLGLFFVTGSFLTSLCIFYTGPSASVSVFLHRPVTVVLRAVLLVSVLNNPSAPLFFCYQDVYTD